MFFTASTTAHKLPLFWIRSIQPMPILPIFWRSLLILSSYLRLGLPIVLCPSGFLIKTLYAPFLFPVRVTFPYKGVPRRKKWTTIWWNLYLISDKLKLNKRQRRKIWCSQSVADEQHNFVELLHRVDWWMGTDGSGNVSSLWSPSSWPEFTFILNA